MISNTTKYKYIKINAVTAGISDIKKAIEEANNLFLNPTGKCILFIDEIHRFNKLQQDALLPFVEDGTVILIGATTENPYFEVNKALISRSMVIRLKPLTDEEILKILKNALINKEGLGEYNISIKEETLRKISEISNGDVRTALNGLEVAVLTTPMDKDGVIYITDEIAADSVGKKKAIFDKSGDSHYDNISAFIKSMRGSDPDATVFYLARAINRRRRSSIFSKKDSNFSCRRYRTSRSKCISCCNSSYAGSNNDRDARSKNNIIRSSNLYGIS